MKKTIVTRQTKQRQLIYNNVVNRCDHPTADMIYEAVKKKDKKVSKGTVYRNLNILSDMGKITHVEVPGGDRFDRTTYPHYHIHCIRCGKVEDVDIKYNYQSDKKMATKSGYAIKGHNIVFEGLCPKCKKNI